MTEFLLYILFGLTGVLNYFPLIVAAQHDHAAEHKAVDPDDGLARLAVVILLVFLWLPILVLFGIKELVYILSSVLDLTKQYKFPWSK